MQFLRNLFSKNTYSFMNLSKEVFIAILLIILPTFYPNTAQAGIFSFISGLAGDKVSAKMSETDYSPNSQNMSILKAVVNVNPSPITPNTNPILASENALVAEIGPAGTASDVDNPTNTEISLYAVRSGDTLSEIAQMFDVSINTIIWANDLGKNSTLRQGQTLVILPITGIRYIVKRGDTIKGIVKKYDANLDEVLQYNDLSLNSALVVGDIVMIPDAEPTITAPAIPSSVAKNPTEPLHNATGPSYPGYYMRPIVGGRKSQGLHGNNAVDLAASVGTPIYAAAGGTVIASMLNNSWNGGYGNYVIISHPNGTQTLYAHTFTNLVSVGQKVSKGEMIAKIGMTGKTTGPHVHFEIRGARNPF
jgi:murein DD-endopeptidase MepM/ murein hydrolase activator NlpD